MVTTMAKIITALGSHNYFFINGAIYIIGIMKAYDYMALNPGDYLLGCLCMCVHVCMYMRVCVCVCLHACTFVRVCIRMFMTCMSLI